MISKSQGNYNWLLICNQNFTSVRYEDNLKFINMNNISIGMRYFGKLKNKFYELDNIILMLRIGVYILARGPNTFIF